MFPATEKRVAEIKSVCCNFSVVTKMNESPVHFHLGDMLFKVDFFLDVTQYSMVKIQRILEERASFILMLDGGSGFL
jgi:hypothetical protein